MLTKSLLLGALAAYTNAVRVGDSDGYLTNYGKDDHDDQNDDHQSDDDRVSDDDHHSYSRGVYSSRRVTPSDGYLARYGDNHAHHSYSYYKHSDEESDHQSDDDSQHSDDYLANYGRDDHHTYRRDPRDYRHYDYRYGPSARHIAKHYGAGHKHQGNTEPIDVDNHNDDEARAAYVYVPEPSAAPAGPRPAYTPQDLSWIFNDDHQDESDHHGEDYGVGHGDENDDDAHAYRRYPYGYNSYNGYYNADPWDREFGYNPEHQGTSKNRETDTYGWANGKFGYGDAYGSNFDEATHDYSDAKAYSANDYYNYGPRDYYTRNHYNPNYVKHAFDKTFIDELEHRPEEHYYEEEADRYYVEEPRQGVTYITEAEEPEYIVNPYVPQGNW